MALTWVMPLIILVFKDIGITYKDNKEILWNIFILAVNQHYNDYKLE